METDEKVQVEPTTEESTEEVSVNVSEDDQNATEDSSTGRRGAPDLSVALKQEREKRQLLEQQLNDPQFAYELAKRHGLTEEEAQEAADQAEERAQTRGGIRQPAPNISALVQLELKKEKAFEKYPDLAKNEDDQLAVSALLTRYGGDPLKAADAYYSRFQQAKKSGMAEAQQQADAAIRAKEEAATAQATAPVTGGQSEAEDIRARMRSSDKRVQAKAYEEWQLYKLRNPNYNKK